MFDKSDGGKPRPSSGAFYDVCAGSFEKCMEFIRANADRQKDWMHYRVWKGLEQCPSWWLDQNRFERA